MNTRVPTAQALRVGAMAVCRYSEGLKALCTRVSKYGDEYQLSYPLVEDGQPCLAVPRNLEGVTLNQAVDLRDAGRAIDCASRFQPHPDHPEQPKVIAASVALLRSGRSHILQAPTGWGKTFVGSEIVCQVGTRALIITTKEDIIGQWVTALSSVLGLPEDDIGIWQADRCDIGKPVTVGMVHSILKGPERYGEEAYQGYGLVLVDEVHRIGADTFSQAMWHLPAKLRLGLSATPTRADGKDDVLTTHIGRVEVVAKQQTLVPKVLMVSSKWRVPKVYRNGKVIKLPHKAGRTMHIEKAMAKDADRVSLVAALIAQAYTAQRSTIVFANTMAMLEAVQQALINLVPPEVIGYYVGTGNYTGSKEEKKQRREEDSRKPIVLATYKMASEATNLPWLDTCVFAFPQAEVTQIVGRIRRVYEGKKHPVVIDVVDHDSDVLAAYAGKRMRWYRSIGAAVEVKR